MTTVSRGSRAERERAGRAVRDQHPRASLGVLAGPAADRDPVALLEAQAVTRVPELVPIRTARMAVGAFPFLRGSAVVMAADLAASPHSGLEVQLCGDAHLSNFGLFASPERRMLFDLNDFDETAPGPFEWDVQRLVASIEVAGRANGFDDAARRQVVVACARAYREAMLRFAAMTEIDVWYARLDVEQAAEQTGIRRYGRRAVEKARGRDHASSLARLTQVVDGRRRFVSDPPWVRTAEELVGAVGRHDQARVMDELLATYARSLPSDRQRLIARYRLVDMARKVVGVGSVGTRAWILLVTADDDDGDDALVLQAKEAQASVLEQHTGAVPGPHGRRVVEGQRLMQAASDIFLGWQTVQGLDGVQRDFYVRQLRDWKGSAEVEQLDPTTMTRYVRLCAWTLARAHARSGDRIAIAAYLGSGTRADEAFAEFAAAYADRTVADHAQLLAAIDAGRLVAAAEVG
ncbi:DUF2252 domain-containing protein [Cellulomonas soli]|uniref:DUF2252 domain-containing protein n=1 Tax=Cellulomonas soli TaxID=931535 RepID=UPI003F837DDB